MGIPVFYQYQNPRRIAKGGADYTNHHNLLSLFVLAKALYQLDFERMVDVSGTGRAN